MTTSCFIKFRQAIRVAVPVALILCTAPGCGTSNLGDCPSSSLVVKCSEKTIDEQIRIALNNQDLDAAKTLLESAIEDEPENYNRYPLLASVYAGLAGFDLLAIATATPSGDSLTSAMDAFIPSTEGKTRSEYSALIALMGSAVETIEATPEVFRAESATNAYAASAIQQLGMYQAAKASMYMKLFTFNFTTGTSDPTELDNLTDEDAAAVMELLANVAAGDGAFAEVAASTLASINAGGGTDRDNLADFLGN